MSKVMLIDDEEAMHVAIRKLLVLNGYEYCGATNGEDGLRMLRDERPDLLLLDVMLPGINGFDICAKIRSEGRHVPIIFVSAKSDIVDKSIGFHAGGDDYVTKPFDSVELMLRIEANIRRHRESSARQNPGKAVIAVGDMEIHFDEYQVLVGGVPAPLTAKEFEIVAYLASSPGKVFSREQIHEHIWHEEGDAVVGNNITVLVRKIREKIEENPSEPKRLLTVHRVGYKLAAGD